MLILHNAAYLHANKDLLFQDIDLAVNKGDKIALIGNNGTGKSTLLKILARILKPSHGYLKADSSPYYMPQLYGQYNNLTIAEALGVSSKLDALREILNGNVSEANLETLNDDWTLEERCYEALRQWDIQDIHLGQKMATLSGGQRAKVFLAGILIQKPQIVLMDEPSNHLDVSGRSILYEYVKTTKDTLIVVSHDRKLLNLLDIVYELSANRGIRVYGGNYDFYETQKKIQSNAIDEDIKSKEKELRKAKVIKRDAIEREQKLDARGKKKQEKAGTPTISMNTLKNNAEKSTAKIKDVHAGKVEDLAGELNELRKSLSEVDKMKIGFGGSKLHKGKILINAKDVNTGYGDSILWSTGLDLQVVSGDRWAIKGNNGSGKTTLVKMILGEHKPMTGSINVAESKIIYIDQDYSLLDSSLSVYQQIERFNTSAAHEHEMKIGLSRFLFTKDSWEKKCADLSGGEKMRLILCCLTMGAIAPDMIILDEPTNNLDMQNIEILTTAVNQYRGTLMVISHDEYFLEKIGISKVLQL
ncbi:MAG: ABC-F family ATP-binding cassette domain-containing protein [Bacteroidetes bacterium]|nr:ABC-F family ATP-binding cassette domain-containing protein [Bacteroidota bacterium]